jgi:integrase
LITIGGYPDWSVEAARKEAARLRVEVDRGLDPLAERKLTRDAETIGELSDRYLAEHARNKRSGGEDARRLRKHVLPDWKGRRLDSITRREVAALVSRIAAQTPYEGNRVQALIRKMFSFAVDKGLLEAHPCLRMQAPGKEMPRDRALQSDLELRSLWAATEPGGAAPEREAAAIRLLLLTGARVSEVAEMRWAEIQGDEWHIPASRTKGKRDHLIPLTPRALAIIHAQPRAEFVFQGPRGGSLTKKHVERAMKTLCATLDGLDPFTPHDLRRTVETGMAAAGIPKEYRDRVLNHKDASVGGVSYNKHDYKEQKRSALETWANRLASALEHRDNVVPFGRAGTN